MKYIIFAALAILLCGCNNTSPLKSPGTEEIPFDNIVNNILTYDELTGKIYTKEEVMQIYKPCIWQLGISDIYNYNDIIEIINVSVVRECGNGYYIVFKMEYSTLFVFMNDVLQIDYMFNLSHSPINKIEVFNELSGKSINKVLEIDPSMLYFTNSMVSEHVLLDLTMVTISYKKTMFGVYVSSVKPFNYLYPDAGEYINRILPIDFPMALNGLS